jgi:hypothetical protein
MIKRWLANVGLAVLFGGAWVIGVFALAMRDAESAGISTSQLAGDLIYGLFELVLFAVVPVLLYVVVGEAIWPRVARQRLASIALGAGILIAFQFALSAGEFKAWPEAWLGGIGAIYGAMARLPGPRAVTGTSL